MINKKVKERLYKSICYRMFSVCLTVIVASLITGSVGIGAGIGVIDNILKFIGYFLFETYWSKNDLVD